MSEIPLAQGKFTLVDDEDFVWLSKYNWSYAEKKDLVMRADGNGSCILMSREVMNAPKRLLVDHKDHNTLNHQRSNLRLCNQSQNIQNSRKTKKKTSSQYKGVYFDRRCKQYHARISLQDVFGRGRSIVHLGYFPVEKEAAEAYDIAARKHFKEFAALNFPEKGEQSCL